MTKTDHIYWLGHDSFRVEGSALTIYFDPWHLPADSSPADLIFVSHEHHDHCSPADVAQIQQADTVIVTVASAAGKLGGRLEIVKPGDQLTLKGIHVQVVPAYNINKYRSPGVFFHPPEAGHAGFIITIDGQRIYHAGDTDHIPEMENLETDIALLPIGGTYVMTVDEAAGAAGIINAPLTIPMHIANTVEGHQKAKLFQELAPVPVRILPFSD